MPVRTELWSAADYRSTIRARCRRRRRFCFPLTPEPPTDSGVPFRFPTTERTRGSATPLRHANGSDPAFCARRRPPATASGKSRRRHRRHYFHQRNRGVAPFFPPRPRRTPKSPPPPERTTTGIKSTEMTERNGTKVKARCLSASERSDGRRRTRLKSNWCFPALHLPRV